MVKPSLPHHGPQSWNDCTDRSTLPIHGTSSIGRPYRLPETLSLGRWNFPQIDLDRPIRELKRLLAAAACATRVTPGITT